MNKFVIRRTLAAFGLLGVGFVGANTINGSLNNPGTPTRSFQVDTNIPAEAAPIDLSAAQSEALAWLRANGTLDSWRPLNTAIKSVAFANNVALAIATGGVCMYAQITDGVAQPVTVDPSGQACTSGALDEARTSWRLDSIGGNDVADRMAPQLVQHAAEVASFTLKGTLTGRPGRLSDIVDRPSPGVTVTERSADRIVLEARVANTTACARAIVHAGGSWEPAPC